jgi:hypothetical protein
MFWREILVLQGKKTLAIKFLFRLDFLALKDFKSWLSNPRVSRKVDLNQKLFKLEI